MPPARTGVADYSASLVRALRAAGADVETNPISPRGIPLYHLGNNPLHAEVYARAIQHPGPVVIHDAVLHHFFLGRGNREGYIQEFVYNYGEWTRGLAADLYQSRARSAQDPIFFQYPMLRRAVERAPLTIVHNPAAAAAAKAHGAQRIVEIPHLAEPVPAIPPAAVARLRAQWNIAPGETVFGVFGHLRESKRIHTVLNAIERVRRQTPVKLLLAGDSVSTDLQRFLDSCARSPALIRAPYLSEPDFWIHAAAVDACINLRYPSAGETSGITIRLMGSQKPVVVTAGPEVDRFPEWSLIRVDPGLPEDEQLLCAIEWIAAQPLAAQRLGRAAAAYLRTVHDPNLVARQFLAALVDYN